MFNSLPLLLLLILSGGLDGGIGVGCNSCENNKNTLAMCLCLLLLSSCDSSCGGNNNFSL